MIRSSRLVLACSMLAALGLAACSGDNGASGSDGRSSLTSVVAITAGAECANGGTRVLTGFDDDGNGKIDEAEAKSSQAICNGANGANGTNGADGAQGVAGKDGSDGQDGADAPAAPGTEVVNAYDAGGVEIGTTAATAFSAKINATGKGKIVAVSNMDAFCYSSNSQYACGASTVRGQYTLSLDANAYPASGSYDYFYLTPDQTENTSRTAVFDVAAAGEVTVHLRASTNAGKLGLFRRSLTLIFVPE